MHALSAWVEFTVNEGPRRHCLRPMVCRVKGAPPPSPDISKRPLPACRYNLPIVVIVMNNNGIYGGDRRQRELKAAAQEGANAGGFGGDPVPTAFVPDSR